MINYNMKNAIIFGIMTLIIGFLIGILIMNPTPLTTTTIPATTTAPVTTTITEFISCSDNSDCPIKMKCENHVCVDVGCIEEGRGLPDPFTSEYAKHAATECCEGLTVIADPASQNPDKNCERVWITGTSRRCTKCGNGVCVYPETKCNCPEDCIISCSDDFDCPSRMRCERPTCGIDVECGEGVCVDVGCVEEGETIPGAISPEYREHMATECCEGLTRIQFSGDYDENCEPTLLAGGPGGTCTKCGNGICGAEETKCNCPEDCS